MANIRDLHVQFGQWRMAGLRSLDPHRMADRSPRLYMAMLNLAATLGYSLVFGLPLLTLLLGGALVSMLTGQGSAWNSPLPITTGIAFLMTAWASYELWCLRPREPEGVELQRRDSPDLFDMLERRINKFKAGDIHRVILTRDAEIKVVRTPASGFLLRQRNTLCLGVPLLHLMTRNQFRVALRCAIGQFANHKDENLGEMVALRDSWITYDEWLHQRKSPGAWLLRAFTSWYSPMFQALSVEAAKQHALTHDQYAIEVIKDIDVLAMIAAEEVGKAYLEQCLWPMLMKNADRHPNPTVRPFSNFEPILQSSLRQQDAEHWLLKSITRPDDPESPQPTLMTRLSALGYTQLHFFSLPTDSAIHFLLGRRMNELLKKMDHQWRSEVHGSWRERHLRFRDEKSRFEKLHERFMDNTLEGDAVIRFACLARRYLSTDEAVDIYVQLLDRNGNRAEILFEMGRLLLDANAVEGLKAIEKAIALDKSYAPRASAAIADYTARRNGVNARSAEADPVRDREIPSRAHVA